MSAQQPVDVDHKAGYKTLGDTSLGTAEAVIRLGGAAGVQEVPAYADTLECIYVHLSPSTLTTLEDVVAWGYLESDDGMSIKPFEFLAPPIGAPLGVTGVGNATPGIHYPVNAPVRPLSKIHAYMQWITGAAATTAAAYAAITFKFTNSRESGQNGPTKDDPLPGVQRYRKVGTLTAVPSSAAGFAPEAAYQINLGDGGGVITELGCMAIDFTPVANLAGGGTCKFASNDVPLLPNTFAVNAFGSILGATGNLDYTDIITRRLCHMETDGVVLLENSYLQGAGKTGTTGDFITFVEFVRGE